VLDEAAVADWIVSFRPGAMHDVFIARLVEGFGRRHVLLLPDERGGSAGDRWTPRPFGGTISRVELDRRLEGGSRIAVVDSPIAPDVMLLAVIRPDGTVDLDPAGAERAPGDRMIVLVPSPG
jgi:hypothetical protein